MKEIEKIVEKYHQINWEKEQVALGTVVKVEGSAYRRIGARMFVSSNGQWVGGISGGCLEGDALKRAKIAIMKKESSIVIYDTTEDDPHQIGVGLGCNGRIEVLLTPIAPDDKNNQIEFLEQIIHKRSSTILLQVLNIKNGDLSLRGTFYTQETLNNLSLLTNVSLAEIKEKIQNVFYKRKSKVFTLTNVEGHEYEVLFELIRPKIKLICIGDNYDVNAFMSIATALGWEIHVAGKQRKLSKIVYQAAKKVYSITEAKNIETDEYSAIVLMSHDYKTDLTLLKEYIKIDIPYIGLLGPKKRMLKMQDELVENDINVDLGNRSNLYSPIGLDIGAESPEEIALAIASEIIAVFREREGSYLKKRKGSIHERN
jgi:xanthine/CO dehydrogenase XdhC/CoxF family maturation factor